MNKIAAKEWTISHCDLISTEEELLKMHIWILKRQKIINIIAMIIGVASIFVLLNILLLFTLGY